MEQLSAELRQTRAARRIDRGPRPPARLHAHAAPAARRGVARLAGAARLHRPSDQPADSAADRRRSPTSPPATGRGALDTGRRSGHAAARRSRARRRRVQPHGRSAAAEPRAARPSHADGQLAVARAQDRARAEELADADSPHRRGDAGAAAARRSRLPRSGRRRSSSARSTRSSGACARSRSSRASRR